MIEGNFKKYDQFLPVEGPFYPLNRLILRIKKLGSKTIDVSTDIDALVIDIEPYRLKREEERWRTGA